jgi:hypothetical protein
VKGAFLLLFALVSPAQAQLGELQVGAVASYGTAGPFGRGAGLVLGVAPGRLVYAGLRWAYHAGDRQLLGPGAELKTRVQVFAADFGVQIPVGALEVVPGVSMGMLQFAQRAQVSAYSREFFAAPGVSLEVRLARIALIPEVQYYLGGYPDLPWAVQHRGAVASMRLVYLREIRRIRR